MECCVFDQHYLFNTRTITTNSPNMLWSPFVRKVFVVSWLTIHLVCSSSILPCDVAISLSRVFIIETNLTKTFGVLKNEFRSNLTIIDSSHAQLFTTCERLLKSRAKIDAYRMKFSHEKMHYHIHTQLQDIELEHDTRTNQDIMSIHVTLFANPFSHVYFSELNDDEDVTIQVDSGSQMRHDLGNVVSISFPRFRLKDIVQRLSEIEIVEYVEPRPSMITNNKFAKGVITSGHSG